MKFTVKGTTTKEPRLVSVVVSADSREEAFEKASRVYKFISIDSVEEKVKFKARAIALFDYQLDRMQSEKSNDLSRKRRRNLA